MNNYPHPLIAREGWPFLAVAGAVALALTALGRPVAAALAWVVFAFVLQFFRDPGRVVPREERAVLAPADGRVVKVEKARDPYLDREALKISVFMNVFNVHSNRSPVDGVVMNVWYSAGQLRQRGARQGLARERAQRAAPHDGARAGRHLRADRRARSPAGSSATRRPATRLRAGSATASSASARGSTSTSPPSAVAKVAVGDRVRATETIIAEFPA